MAVVSKPRPGGEVEEAIRLGVDLVLVGFSLVGTERLRMRRGPSQAVESARRMGRRWPTRDGAGRARLQRAIRWVDRSIFREPNCYRRVLVEIALDGGAAVEKLILGFRAGGSVGSGHAWLESTPPVASYDALIEI